jgi:hypothetical protein
MSVRWRATIIGIRLNPISAACLNLHENAFFENAFYVRAKTVSLPMTVISQLLNTSGGSDFFFANKSYR